MILLSSNVIMILHDDATMTPFDADDIQTSIIKACIAAGETESWIAGDLSLSVEFALLAAERRTLREGELNDMVTRALEESGYPAVAAEYKRLAGTPAADYVPVAEQSIRDTLSMNISLPEERMSLLVKKVESALSMIGFVHVSPRLILELGRQFRDGDPTMSVPSVSLPRPPTHRFKSGEGILMRQNDLAPRFSPELQTFIDSGILRIRNVSRLFPALRISIYLAAFSDYFKLEKPVTELAFWSQTTPLTEAVEDLLAIAEQFCIEKGRFAAGELPFYVNVPDAVLFAGNYMNCQRTQAKECVNVLLSAFLGSLSRQPFKVSLS